MESSTPQTREPSSRRHRRVTKTTTYTESASSPIRSQPTPKSTKKSKKKVEEPVYATKEQAILEEKRESGQIKFLVNWADNPNTGEVYEPTWEPQSYVTLAGRKQWQDQKHLGQVVRRGAEGCFVLNEDFNQETDNTNGTKRKRDDEDDQVSDVLESDSTSRNRADSEEPTSKRARRTGSNTPIRSTPAGTPEVQDSYGQENIIATVATSRDRGDSEVYVEVALPENFDRTEYLAVEPSQITATQSSPAKSEPVLLEDPDDSIEASSPFERGPTGTSRNGIDRFVVPDSQDRVPDSDTWEPSQDPKSVSTTDTSQIETQSEGDSLLPSYSQQENQLQEPAIDSQSAQAPGHDTVDSSNLGPASSIVDFGALPVSLTEAADPTPRSRSQSALVSGATSPLQPASDSIEIATSPQSIEPVVVQSLLTPTRQIHSPHIEHSSSPSSQILLGSTRNSQANSSNPSQGQLLSPNADRSRVNTPEKVTESVSQSTSDVHSGAQVVSSLEPQSQLESLDPNPHSYTGEAQAVPATQSITNLTAVHIDSSVSEVSGEIVSQIGIVQPTAADSSSRGESPSAFLYTTRRNQAKFSTPSPKRYSVSLEATSTQAAHHLTPPPFPDNEQEAIRQSIETPEHSIDRVKNNTQVTRSPSLLFSSQRSRMDAEEAKARRAVEKAARRQQMKDEFDVKIRAAFVKRGGRLDENGRVSIGPSSSTPQNKESLPSQLTTDKTSLHDVEVVSASDKAPILVNEERMASQNDESSSKSIEEIVDRPQSAREVTDVDLASEIDQLEMEPTPELDVTPSTSDEYFIALPMNAGCRDVYHQILRSSKNERADFMEKEYDEELSSKITDMISALELLCSHPDLHSDDYSTQRMDSIITQAKFAENRSTKCIFVAELLHEMRLQNKHITIVARPGRMLEILAAVLEYHEFDRQPTSTQEYQFQHNLKVSLVPSEGLSPTGMTTDLVIAFDSTFSHNSQVSAMRTKSGAQALSPLVHLVVSQSVEHLQALFSESDSQYERHIKIVGCLSYIMDDVGKGVADPTQVAKEIASFIFDGGIASEWPCDTLPIITCAQGYVDDMRSSSSPKSTFRKPAVSPLPPSTLPLPSSNKRQLEDDDAMNVDSPKRQRLTPSPDEMDSMVPQLPTTSAPNFLSQYQPSNNVFNGARGPSTSDQSVDGISTTLEQENIKLRKQLREKEESETDLRRLNTNLQAQLADLQASMKSMQPKYQEALNDRAEFEHQQKLATAAAQRLQKDLEARQQEIETLKQQNQSLGLQVSEARTIMASSTIPSISKLAELGAQVELLTEEKQRLEKQKQNANNDLNFMRERYQSASSAAAESASVHANLQAEINTLRKAASANKVEIHKIQCDQEKAGYIRMLKQLKIQTIEIQRELDKKSGELATVMNGRRSTRGTSTPMSPRVMSPGGSTYAANANRGANLSRILQQQQARSRGSSPSVAERAAANVSAQPVFGEMLPGNRFIDGSRRG